jgi:hypothetical protein
MKRVDLGGLGALLGAVATYVGFPVLVYLAVRGERAAKEARQAQANVDHGVRAETACQELATASHAFLHTLRRLPSVDVGTRGAVLDDAFAVVRSAYDAVRFWASPTVAASGARLFLCAEQMERRAMSRAVVRSALSALEQHWCPGLDGDCDGNAEVCNTPRHWVTFRACELLEEWGDRDEWQRFDVRGELEYMLSESGALDEDHLVELRNVLNWGVDWRVLIMRDVHWERELSELTAAFVDVSRRERMVTPRRTTLRSTHAS